MTARPKRAGLADPTRLPSFDPDDPDLTVVIIETPKGSRNKYAYDPQGRIFSLTKVKRIDDSSLREAGA